MFSIFATAARPVALLVLFSTSSILTITAPVEAFTVSTRTSTKPRNCQLNGNIKMKKKMNSKRPKSYSPDVNYQGDRWLSQQLFSSPNNEEEMVEEQKNVKSYYEAGASLIEEDDEEKLRGMGDFDSNPESKEANMARMREAIRLRTADMGLEKSELSQEYFQELSKKSREGRENVDMGGTASEDGLDLSQISSEKMVAGSKTGNRGESSLPSVLYDPEDDMSEEEMKEVDKVGQLPLYEQVQEELSNAKWPTLGAATREVILLIIIVVITAGLVVNWDQFLRNLYTDLGFIPSAETLESSFSKIDFLPEGWTNGMNDQDVAGLQDEMAASGKNLDISPK